MEALIKVWSCYTAIYTYVYIRAITNASCPCSSVPNTQHNYFSVKSKGICYAAAQLELEQPFCELPAQEVFTLHVFRSVSNGRGPCGLFWLL